ncbi:hypothetical protein CKA32_004065 [Geitlerinema sp. FC II]|nr:hypothetical protein CKA32_004065 [Geitlerinema sp. FC II]
METFWVKRWYDLTDSISLESISRVLPLYCNESRSREKFPKPR